MKRKITLYGGAYLSQTRDQKYFIISEVTGELMVIIPQRTMRP